MANSVGAVRTTGLQNSVSLLSFAPRVQPHPAYVVVELGPLARVRTTSQLSTSSRVLSHHAYSQLSCYEPAMRAADAPRRAGSGFDSQVVFPSGLVMFPLGFPSALGQPPT